MVTSNLSASNICPQTANDNAPTIENVTSSVAAVSNVEVETNASHTTNFKGSKNGVGMHLLKTIIFFFIYIYLQLDC